MKKIISIVVSILIAYCFLVFDSTQAQGPVTPLSASPEITDSTQTQGVSAKPISTGPVKVDGTKLWVNIDRNNDWVGDGYVEFKIKGVGYQPYPIGTFPSQWGTCEYVGSGENCTADNKLCNCDVTDVYDRPQLMDRDFPLIKQMHANTIRTWDKVTHILMDKAKDYNLKVCAGFWIDYNADIDPGSSTNVREAIKQQFHDYVLAFKDEPALLIWVVGNENNLWNNPNNRANWYSLVNELAQEAYNVEGAAYHPVATANGEINDIGISQYNSTDSQMSYLDIWGANIYSGISFGTRFTSFVSKSSKPLWISEYGIDALNNTTGQEYPEIQAQWNVALLKELSSKTVCIGSSLMEYSDEWWKQDEWTADVSTHDAEGNSMPGAAPDNYQNEEYFGIMRIQDNGSLPDIMTARQEVFDGFKATLPIYVPQDYPTVREAADAAASGDTIIVSAGTYSVQSGESFPIYLKNGVKLLSADGPTATSIDVTGGIIGIYVEGGNLPSAIQGFTIKNARVGIQADGTLGTIKNNIVKNCSEVGIVAMGTGNEGAINVVNNNIDSCPVGINIAMGYPGLAQNNIITNCPWGIRGSLTCVGTYVGGYNDFYAVKNSGYNFPVGATDKFSDPLFVDSANGDFHLKNGSPCIDAGNPTDDYSKEPAPNGGRINMGAYGNTAEATKTSTPPPGGCTAIMIKKGLCKDNRISIDAGNATTADY